MVPAPATPSDMIAAVVFAEYSGMAIKARMATIVTTIINSTNVNACLRRKF
jgi:hypothetical protein